MRLNLLLILLLFVPMWPRVVAAPLAVQGSVDLAQVDWQAEPIFNLSGGWEFYWNQLLSPSDIAAGQGKITVYISPEAEWHKTKIPGVELHRIGAATYQLRVYSPEPKDLMLALPIINSASKIWINGEIKHEFGRTSLTAADEVGHIRHSDVPFLVQKGENLITLQMSNHMFWYGGMSHPIRLGLPDALHKEQLRSTVQDALSFGFILFMALYHLYIRLLLKRSNGALYFGLFTLAIGLRMGFVGDGQIFYQMWPDAPMQLRYFVEYIAVSAGTGFSLLFYRELYPHESPRKLYNIPIALCFAWVAFIVVAPALYYPSVLELFQILILTSGILSITTVIRAARRGRDGARLMTAANFLFYVAIANDIVYHHRFVDTFPILHYGLNILMFCQALTLAQRFARTFDRAEKAEQEVTKLNQGLEQKILERTEQINVILSHARSGFLLVDRDTHLQTGFTSSCQSILGKNLRVGESLPKQLGLAPHLEMQIMMAIQQIHDSDLPTEVAMQQLPSRFPIGSRMIGLQVAAVKARGTDKVTAVLLTINDVTDLVAAEEGLRRADILINILEDQDAFRIFLADFKKDLESATQAVAERNSTGLHSILHTMKGNAASFNLDDWVNHLHYMEDKDDIEIKDIQNLAENVREFLRQNEGILHLDFDHPMRSVFAVDQNDLNILKDTLAPLASPPVMTRVENWSRSVKALPLKSYTTPLGSMVQRMARQLQKNVNLVVEGAEAKVDSGFASLLSTLPHLIRNSLVHGIEDPEERGSKPAKATIKLRFTPQTDGGLHIDIVDDGRGLDLDSIRSHALAQGLLEASQPMNEEETLALIFHPNFSTADKVTELAGRGMGLAAVAQAVRELGGHYDVKTQKSLGFQLMIRLPSPAQSRLERVS